MVGGEEQSQQLEEAGILRLADFLNRGGLAGKFHFIFSGQVLRLHPAADASPDLVIGREGHAVPADGAEFVNILGAGRECAFGDVNFLAVEAGDDPARQVDHLIDSPPDAAGSEDARFAGDAGVGRLDRAALGAGVPLIDRVVVLHAGIGAAPRGEGDLFPQIAGA